MSNEIVKLRRESQGATNETPERRVEENEASWRSGIDGTARFATSIGPPTTVTLSPPQISFWDP
jgi:hypothetical protein